MQITEERRIAAPQDRVWTALNDLATLRRAIPGCRTLEPRERGGFTIDVLARVGPADTGLSGSLVLDNVDPPHRVRLSGEGRGVSGFASGAGRIELIGDGGETIVRYDVEARFGGKLAQFGARLLDPAARTFADEFFRRFTVIVEDEPVMEQLVPPAALRTGLRPALWVPALVALNLAVLYIVSQL